MGRVMYPSGRPRGTSQPWRSTPARLTGPRAEAGVRGGHMGQEDQRLRSPRAGGGNSPTRKPTSFILTLGLVFSACLSLIQWSIFRPGRFCTDPFNRFLIDRGPGQSLALRRVLSQYWIHTISISIPPSIPSLPCFLWAHGTVWPGGDLSINPFSPLTPPLSSPAPTPVYILHISSHFLSQSMSCLAPFTDTHTHLRTWPLAECTHTHGCKRRSNTPSVLDLVICKRCQYSATPS